MRLPIIIATLVLFSASSLLAASSPAPEKVKELAAAKISGWQPGKMKASPAFSKLAKPKAAAGTDAGGTRNTATLQYDNGSITALPTVFGAVYGNRYQRYLGGPPGFQTITLNNFQFYFMEDSAADTGMFFQPADPLTAAQISARASQNVTGLANSGPSFSNPQLNVVNQSALATTGVFNSTFFLGAWCLNSLTAFPINNEAIGLATNTHAGGLHGYTAVSGIGPVAFAAQNFQAVLRVNITSPQTVPVELMSFEVSE